MRKRYWMNGASPDRELGVLQAQMETLRDQLAGHAQANRREFERIWKGLAREERERKALQRSINMGIASFAIFAGAILFDLLRKGVVF